MESSLKILTSGMHCNLETVYQCIGVSIMQYTWADICFHLISGITIMG